MEMPPNIPIEIGTSETTTPKRNAAKISPITIVEIKTGDETNLSNVLLLVSHEGIIETIAVEVKNSVIPTKPGSINSMDKFLLMKKAKNRKNGNKIPWTITG